MNFTSFTRGDHLIEAVNAVLSEASLEKTLAKLGDKLSERIERDTSAGEDVTPESLYKRVESEIDPDPRKKYTVWVLRTYANGGIRMIEDLDRVAAALDIHFRLKEARRLEGRQADINSFKKLSDLEALTRERADFKSGKEQKSREGKFAEFKDGIEFVYEGPEGYVLVPKTEEASCGLFQDTAWCTARPGNSYFDQYSKQGPLVVLHDEKLNAKFQFHKESKQYLDKNDEEIDVETLKQINRKLLSAAAKKMGLSFKDLAISISPAIIAEFKDTTEEDIVRAIEAAGRGYRSRVAEDIFAALDAEKQTPPVVKAACEASGRCVKDIKNKTVENYTIAIGSISRYNLNKFWNNLEPEMQKEPSLRANFLARAPRYAMVALRDITNEEMNTAMIKEPDVFFYTKEDDRTPEMIKQYAKLAYEGAMKR